MKKNTVKPSEPGLNPDPLARAMAVLQCVQTWMSLPPGPQKIRQYYTIKTMVDDVLLNQ